LPLALLTGFVVVFCSLAGLSARHINSLWDEVNDHTVAVSLLEDPFVGDGLDGSQARLPMYITAGVYAVTGPSIRVARAVSIAMGAAAIVLTFIAGRRWSGAAAGLLAVGLLSIAPYFLTFARTGMTEGDAFCPAVVLLMLLAFDSYLRRRDSVRLILFAAALGFALATKFYAVFFLPALAVCDALDLRRRAESQNGHMPIQVVHSRPIGGRGLLIWALSTMGLEVIAAAFAQMGASSAAVVFWAVGLVALLAGPLDQFLIAPQQRRTARRLMEWNTLGGWLVILPIAAAVCGAVCPAHVLNPEIARALIRSIVDPVEPESMVRLIDPARLYLGVILLKLGPPLGILSLAALAWACLQRSFPGLSIASASAVIYLLFLLVLPIRQSFYLMSVYPLIVLILAAFITHVAARLSSRERSSSAWIALVATSSVYLAWGTAWSYPEFGYYGYTLVGDSWLGAESYGYRNLIQVTNDGTEDALRWLTQHVPPGRRVVSYLWDDHVIDHFLAGSPPLFHLVRRDAHRSRNSPPEIDDADFVVVGLNNEVSYRDLPKAELEEGFNQSPRHVVFRGRSGSCMPVVRIFGRATPASRSATRSD
jgi:4-amino-4-deoxy-L-arabinose transferase-like glycosyltransferase